MKIDKKSFIEQVVKESSKKKILTREALDLLIDFFTGDYPKEEYPKTIKDPKSLALEFYKKYNENYYDMLINGLNNGSIIIEDSLLKSYVDTTTAQAHIKLNGNDNDLFILVHEYAHYIDRNMSPPIVPDTYWFFAETYAFYLEKQLELYLGKEYPEYHNLIQARRNNRMHYESKMVDALATELHYEDLYRKKQNLSAEDIDESDMNRVARYNFTIEIVNCLSQYPVANIISSRLLANNLVKDEHEFVDACLSIDLISILSGTENKKEIKPTIKETTKK